MIDQRTTHDERARNALIDHARNDATNDERSIHNVKEQRAYARLRDAIQYTIDTKTRVFTICHKMRFNVHYNAQTHFALSCSATRVFASYDTLKRILWHIAQSNVA